MEGWLWVAVAVYHHGVNGDQDELLDVLDGAGVPTGEQKARGAVHRDGDWHGAVHVWVVKDGKYVLLQRRSRLKDLEAGKVDVTVGGHRGAGEGFRAVLREAEEEIGLRLSGADLTYLGTVRSERVYATEPPTIDREFQDVYVVADDRPLTEYTLAPEEVEVLYEVPVEAAIELFRNAKAVAVAGFDAQRRPSNALLYENDLLECGRELHAAALEKVVDWLAGVPADVLALQPFSSR